LLLSTKQLVANKEMKMKSWIKYCKAALNRRFLVPLAAVAMILSLTAYEFDKPASAAAPAAAAAPLDDNSVSALLSLDRAMEALAARVTPAIVNVTVTSKKSGDHSNPAENGDNSSDNDSNGLQQFFGKQFGFGPHGFGQQMGPQSNIEHGLGSGVIISPMATS
jgi:serine protease Do